MRTSTAPRSVTLSARAVLLAVAVLVASLALPSVAGAQASADEHDIVPDRILVKWAPGTTDGDKARGRSAAGAEKINEIEQLGVDLLRVPEHAAARALQGLQRNPHVEYAEHDTVSELEEITPNDPWYGYQGTLRRSNTSQAWDVTTGSSDVTIAILDTGLTPSAELQGKVLPGWNTVTNSSDVSDANGHGTRAASVATVNSNNAAGIAGYCWACRILPVKVMDTSTGTMSDVAEGIVWATDNGAQIINMSLSGSSGSATLLDAVRYAQGRNVLLIAAAGNQGSSSPRYPAAYAEVIAVAGANTSDGLYSWSNYGSWVDMAAPGINYSVGTDASIATFSGTSSASPALAGIAGLAFSLDSRPTAAQVRRALEDGAVDIGSVVEHGRVDALATIVGLGGGSSPAPTPAPPSISVTQPSQGDTVTGTVTVAGTAASNDTASISKVEVTVAGAQFTASGTTSWSRSIDTSSLPDGTTRITATATTTSGASTSAAVDVVVSNASPPSISVTSPSSGESVNGSFTVTGGATPGSNATVSSVDVRLGSGTWQRGSGTTSWTAALDSTAVADGSAVITARVTDSAGRTAEQTVTVQVDNASDQPASGPSLTVTTSKVKGRNIATLSWSADVTSPGTVLRDGTAIATVKSGTTHTDDTKVKGSPTFSYQVCGTDVCTDTVLVKF